MLVALYPWFVEYEFCHIWWLPVLFLIAVHMHLTHVVISAVLSPELTPGLPVCRPHAYAICQSVEHTLLIATALPAYATLVVGPLTRNCSCVSSHGAAARGTGACPLYTESTQPHTRQAAWSGGTVWRVQLMMSGDVM